MDDPQGVIGAVLPAGVVSAEMGDETVSGRFAEEERIVANAVPARRSEFFAGRECARRALGAFGLADAPIGQVDGRRPRWPEGFVGSITHCNGYRAAAVARTGDFVSIGIDAETDLPLPESVLDLISSPEEREVLAHLSATSPGVSWDRLLFSAKEAVFKAWSPTAGGWLGFEEVGLDIDGAAGRFRARLLSGPWSIGGADLAELEGRWASRRGLLVTSVVIPR